VQSAKTAEQIAMSDFRLTVVIGDYIIIYKFQKIVRISGVAIRSNESPCPAVEGTDAWINAGFPYCI
jgi:hypothetical protein